MNGTETFDFILDSFALLSHFEDESGAARVREVLTSAEREECRVGMSIINLGEVAYLTERERGLPQVHEMLATVRSLPITILPADETAVFVAAHMKANYRMSYADAFAAAAAQRVKGTLLTGDPEFKPLDGSVITVEWLSG